MRTESVLTYIPIDRRHSLATGEPLPVEVIGSALFADISGFTPLTEGLARAFGPRLGAEELSRQLNRVYDALVEEVHLYGGTIISFSGDAITCWFDGAESPPDAALRALTCAFALQSAMHPFSRVRLPDGSAVHLSIKVVVASGSARRFIVGDPTLLLLDVLAGSTLNRMAEGEHHIVSGEVAADSATLDLIPGTCDIREWRTVSVERFAVLNRVDGAAAPHTWQPLDAARLQPEHVRAWVLPTLYERVDEPPPELRPAVAMFVSFDGIDYDGDPESGHKLDAFIRWVQSILVRYDGSLMQITMGDKGSHFYAAFGAPTAHENNAARAASAALDLRSPPPDVRYIKSIRIGISQGIMRTGAYGGKSRRTYGALGDDVNLAARLMTHAAPGQILVSGRAHKALATGFVLEEREPIPVKGKREPQPIARLVSHVDEYAHVSTLLRPLVGRGAELERLKAHVQAALSGQPGGCVWVYGDAGIGKTRLVHELRRQYANQVMWFNFETDPLVHESLHPVLPALREFFAFDLSGNNSMKRAWFDRRMDRLVRTLRGTPNAQGLADEVSEARWWIGALLGLHWKGSPYEISDPKARFDRSLRALDALLRANSHVKPVVLHVQGAQWLDPDSRALLDWWIESAAGCPTVVIVDSRELDRDLISRHADHIDLLSLRELDTAAVAELAANVLSGQISASVARYLTRRANGSPLFTEQLALDLVERRALVVSPAGEWLLDASRADDIPADINAVLIARLDRLPADVRMAVQFASVIGQEFESPVLAGMMGDADRVRALTQQAENETIFITRGEKVIAFRHTLLRDAAYAVQSQERLRDLHALAGAAIETVYADDLDDHAPDLAYHYEKAGLLECAAAYLVKSARAMIGLHASREAIGYYCRALDLAPHAPDDQPPLTPDAIASIQESLGDLHDAMSEYAASAEHYDHALALLSAADHARRAALYRKQGQVLHKCGRTDEAVQAYRVGLVEVQSAQNPQEACQLYTGLSVILYRQGSIEDALELATTGLMMAQLQEDKRNRAYAAQTLGMLYWKTGEYAAARQLYNESMTLWQETQNTLGMAAVHNHVGMLNESMGSLTDAASAFEQGAALFEGVSSPQGLAAAYEHLARIHRQLGNEERAASYQEQAARTLAQGEQGKAHDSISLWQLGMW